MLIPAILLALVGLAAGAPPQITVTGHSWAPFISPMGEPYRARAPGHDTMADWFHRADRNGDGVLTDREMSADAERFFLTLDTDGNGQIEPEELVQYEWDVAPEIQVGARWRSSSSAPKPAATQARNEDSRGSDGLDLGLQGAARYALLNIPEPVAAADYNLDRAISLAEFRAAASERFGRLDRNHKSGVTLQDMEALRPPEFVPGAHAKRRPKDPDVRVGIPLPAGD